MALTRPTLYVRTRQTVVKELSTKPYVGFEHLTSLPDGWEYDIKRWCSPFDLRLPNMPRLLNPSSQGVSEETYFTSGVGSVSLGDLEIEDIINVTENNVRYWVPLIRHGLYFRNKTDYFFYSDNSVVQYIDPSDNRDSRNYIELAKTPKLSTPISVASYKRNPDTDSPSYHTRLEQMYKFTGLYSEGEELETVSDAGKITWSNVDTTKREFLIDNTIDGLTRLFMNKDYVKTIGVDVSSYKDVAACEVLGTSTGAPYQSFYLDYFPVIYDSSFHLYVATDSSYEEWTPVDSWWDLITQTWSYDTGNKYFVDKDLGIVYLGASDNGGVPAIGRTIAVSYRTTLRVEYEEDDKDYEIQAIDANVNPITQGLNQGFVCITHEEIEPANITLGIDKRRIQGTYNPSEYGPIYVGSDYAVLKSTVTSRSGLPVPNASVGFVMEPKDVGYIGGSTTDSAVTNSTGHAYSNFQPPTSADTLGFYSTTVRASTNPYYPNCKDVIIKQSETGLEGKENEIYLYHILKDDVILGYDSIDDFLLSLYNEKTPSWVNDSADYAVWKQEMILEYDLKDWTEPVEGEPIDGRKVVIYKQDFDNPYPYPDDTAINPITGEYGAFVPLRPYLAEKITTAGDPYYGLWRLIYPEDAIPDVGTNNIGGYWATSSRVVKFQAHCWSPHYNRIIYSNEISARISLPSYLLGEYLNSLGEKIPFGWKIIGLDNVAAGLNGATFITINPHTGPYEIIDLVGDTGGTGTWVDGAPNTLHFQFEVIE